MFDPETGQALGVLLLFVVFVVVCLGMGLGSWQGGDD